MNHNTVRTFRAQDPKAALDIVKAMMGPDAVIISTREVGGSLFKRGEIEITAALPAQKPKSKENKRAQKKAAAAYGPSNEPTPVSKHPAFTKDDNWIFEEWESANNPMPLENKPQEAKQNPAFPLTANAKLKQDVNEDPEPYNIEDIEPRNLRFNNQGEKSILAQNAQALIAATKSQTLPQKPSKAIPSPELPYSHMPPHARQLMRELQRKGLSEEIAEDIIECRLTPQTCHSNQTLRKEVAAAMRKRLPAMTPPWKTQRRKIMALVGPTGVGKTTTIAKIAARAIIESRLSVALISIDTFRIGAAEQLKRYGEIMSAPTFICRNEDELAEAIEQTQDCDLVLVDTAGRADKSSILKQTGILQRIPELEIYLTLSAACGYLQMAGAASTYRMAAHKGVIITKIDESFSPGSIFAAEISPSTPLCCYTDGQTVPEDLHQADSQKLVDLILDI